MFIEEILNSWNKNILVDHEVYFWESLLSTYPQNCYIIDRYPKLNKHRDLAQDTEER